MKDAPRLSTQPDGIPPALKCGVILALFAGVFGAAIGWWEGHTSPADAAPAPIADSPHPGPTAAHPEIEIPSDSEEMNVATISSASPSPPLESTNGWEETLDSIILGTQDATNKPLLLVELLQTAPPSSQREIAQYLAAMATDENYGPVAGILTNAIVSTDASTILMQNLVLRRDSVRLPVLVAISLNDQHPMQEEARRDLSVALMRDDLTNSDLIRAAADERLRPNQPDGGSPGDAGH